MMQQHYRNSKMDQIRIIMLTQTGLTRYSEMQVCTNTIFLFLEVTNIPNI